MRFKNLLLSFIFFIILFPVNTKAIMCSNKDEVAFQEQAKNITTKYDYVEKDGTAIFNITFSNIPQNFIITYPDKNQKYNYTSSELNIDGFYPGRTYRFDVYVDDVNCFLEKLYTIYVEIPSYNIYHNTEICKGIEDYELCQKWTPINMSYTDFVYEVSLYKYKTDEPVFEEVDETVSLFEIVLNFYVDYYYIILPVIIIVSWIIMYKHNKKNDLF